MPGFMDVLKNCKVPAKKKRCPYWILNQYRHLLLHCTETANSTSVFGGLDKGFYDAYDEKYPLTGGAWERIKFYKLCLLMVHLVKFGSVYARSVNETMDDILDGK